MRRFVTLALILIFSIPVGISISGCSKGGAVAYCNGGSSGLQEGQITTINMEPRYYGISLNYGSIGQIGSPSAADCKGDSVGVVKFEYGTTNIAYADVSPSGSICAGSWNRNSPNGVADYTTCNPPANPLPLPSFSTPTTPTSSAGATATLGYGNYTSGINGTIDIKIGSGPVLTGTIASTTTAAQFATAFNAIPAFSTNGLTATANSTGVTITGPAGAANTLSFTGTSLAASGFVPVGYITASAGGATSNPVPVYVHPTVTSVQLQSQTSCFSQGVSTPLVASVTANVNGTPTDVTALAGPLNFAPQDGSVVSINSTVIPPIATAQLPGSTILSVSTSSATSPAGIFYTCPPKSITLNVANSTATSVSLNLNTPQNLTATVMDTNNKIITGLNLEYVSTSPRTVNSTSAGSITASYPGAGAITAICQPGSCNPSPLNYLGEQGNGVPITSNPIQVTTPGTVNTVLYIASTSSQYFTNVDFQSGVVGSPSRLPYVPNSMIADANGTTLYFGSPSELMEVSALTNSVIKEDASVKGAVVGVSNDGTSLVMSDSVHNLIYIYTTSNGSNVSFAGTATHAQYSPDNQTVYITGSNTNGNNFFVYSLFNGYHAYTLPVTPKDIAVTVPSIGAYLAGTITTARSYCPAGGSNTNPPTDYYPQADSQAVPTDHVAATNDSHHILGASAMTDLFDDFTLTLPSFGGPSNPGACPSGSGFVFTTVAHPLPLGVTPTTVTGVIPAANSSLAFVTYTNAGGGTTGTVLPAYNLTPGGAPTPVTPPVTLSNGASAPVSGVFSPDGQTFYTGTASDNLVHRISVPNLGTGNAPDIGSITPNLPLCQTQDALGNCTSTAPTSGTGAATALPNLLSDRPRPTS